MEALKERIRREGKNLGRGILKVDGFINHQVDPALMLAVGGVDLFVQRGWYSTTDFWSPDLFEQHVLPNLRRNVACVHEAGAKFAYVMTTGIKPLLRFLPEAGVDLLYWVDPVMGGGRGEINAPSPLQRGHAQREVMMAFAPGEHLANGND